MPEDMVYFLRSDQAKMFKIGHSIRPEGRIPALKTGFPFDLYLFGQVPGGEPREKQIQSLLSHHNVDGEWFHANDEVVTSLLNIMKIDGALVSVEDELKRRNHCRYGLRGVKVLLKDNIGTSLIVRSSYWGKGRNLRLKAILESGSDRSDFNRKEQRPDDIRTIEDIATLADVRLALSTEDFIDLAASDVFLFSDWPVTCGCWMEE